MKVLLLTTHLNVGGVGVYTVNLARYLQKEGVNVVVASSGGDLEKRLTDAGISHVKLKIKTKFEFSIKVWKTLPGLIKLIKHREIQVIHAQTRVTQVLGRLLSKITGIPLVTTCHGAFKYLRLSRRLLPCWGSKVIAISNDVRKHLLEDFNVPKNKVNLIYNGIETEKYFPKESGQDSEFRKSINVPLDAIVIGTVGRLSSVKGYKYLVSAFKQVVSRNGNVCLIILGDGPEKDNLQKQVEELGVGGKVMLIPGDIDLKKYLALMDIFCLPSLREGLGLSMMEAMAAGKACIASEVGGMVELIVHEEDGLFVPSGNSDALSEAMSRLIRDKELRCRLGENAYKKAIEKFSIKESVAKTIKVYKTVVPECSYRESIR